MEKSELRERLTVGVVGFGTMGSELTAALAAAGFRVIAWNRSEERFEKLLPRVRRLISRQQNHPEELRQRGLDLLETTTDLNRLAEARFVVENLVEDRTVKVDFFQKLNQLAHPEAVFATNTSSLPVAELAEASGRPQRFLGLHFFNPVTRMELVEVVRHPALEESVLDLATALVEAMGKTPVVLNDAPGFIVNRILVTMVNEAIRLVEQGVASPKQVDTAMKLGTGVPVGPLKLLDLVGLDTHLKVCEHLYEKLGEPQFAPPKLLRRLVEEGKTGRKAGEGFYSYR